MVSLLAVRQHLAKLRGYESWAHYAQRDSLLQSPQHVEHFLEDGDGCLGCVGGVWGTGRVMGWCGRMSVTVSPRKY